MTTATSVTTKSQELFEKPVASRKMGVVIACALSLLILVMSLPFVNWIQIVNTDVLFSAIELNDPSMIRSGYTLYNFLSFVQNSGVGALGFMAMMLMLLLVAAVLFHVIFIVRIASKSYRKKGYLKLYSMGKTGMILSFIASAASIAYVVFANGVFGVTGLMLTPVVYCVPVLAVAAYIVISIMEKRERMIQHEHGFLVELKRNWMLFAFLIPCAVYLLINNYLPMSGIYFAFTQFNFRDGLFASPFVGFKNFEFLAGANLMHLTTNTIMYNVVFIVLGNILQIIFAIFVSQVGSKWFKKTSQTMIFMPYFVSYVILNVLVYNLFEYDFGIINTYLTSFGFDKVDFYNTPSYWPFLIVIFNMWKGIGYGMIVYLATIMGISDEYYDAAKVDGANVFQQIMYITIPLLKPTFIILLLYALGGIMKGQFELFYQLVGNNGVLYNATDIFDTYVYRITTTQPLSMGLGAAAGLYQSVFGLVVILVSNYFIKRGNPDYALF